ncbi:hypothetical protein [Luteibacter sp. ME-Dv--P-043b]|uniref:phosphoribosyltransferase-like protein n=1 Tax=Luteibacter sp. ME-Dv--P-043b TaxID=3040291 RepID=UPI0025559AA0|nr:hypothetical protein [Luteibacter sp. ME-Dv--P-043b]
MGVIVPSSHEDLSRQVFGRFRSLVVDQVIDIISPTDLDRWSRNFETAEAQYLAAQLLSAAVIRTNKMITSSYRHIAEVVLPDLMRSAGLWNFDCVEDFLFALHDRKAALPLRIMPVDGLRIDRKPGNSADSVVRNFAIAAKVGDGYLWRADDPKAWQPFAGLLIFVDDLLGTGRQFAGFAKKYQLNELPPQMQCVYIPLLATAKGIGKVREKFPRVEIRPVESLHASAGFFNETVDNSGLWVRDKVNAAEDVRALYRQIMSDKDVPKEGKYSMELSVLLPGRTPNNSLRAYWNSTGRWQPLMPR